MNKQLNLGRKWRVISDFRHVVATCNIMSVPTALKDVLESGAWKMWIEPAGVVREHQSFYSFITTPALKGCGFDPVDVEALLNKAADKTALDMWKQAIRSHENTARDAELPDLKPHGTNQHDGVGNEKIVTNSINDASYALRRLRKDRPDIHARVLAGELTPHGGMVEAGFRKKRQYKKRMKHCPKCHHEW